MGKRAVDAIEYEERLLVFVDVLGWAAMTDKSTRSRKVRQQMTSVVHELMRESAFMKRLGLSQATVFSDSWAVSLVPGEDAEQEVLTMLDAVGTRLAVQLLRQGCYARGAIVFGKLFHEENVIIGPALVRAVHVEKAACYPRIVIDQTARRLIPKSWVHVDPDGTVVLDYLRHAAQDTPLLLNNTRFLRKVIKSKLRQDAADPKLMAKHRWVLTYVDAVEAEAKE